MPGSCVPYMARVNVLTVQHNHWGRIFFSIQECIFGIRPIRGKMRSAVWTVQRGRPGFDSRTMQFSLWQLLQLFLVLAKFNTVLTKKNTVLAKFNTVLAKFNTILTKKITAEFSDNFSYSVDSSLGRVPACHAGGPGSIPGRCSSIFGIWREVLGLNVYIMSQYFFPAIIYRDIILHITITYRYIMYFFRTFKKSTAPYKVHNMGLRYINNITF